MIIAIEDRGGLPEDPDSGQRALLPDKYGSDQTSGLTAVVGEEDNVVDFYLP